MTARKKESEEGDPHRTYPTPLDVVSISSPDPVPTDAPQPIKLGPKYTSEDATTDAVAPPAEPEGSPPAVGPTVVICKVCGAKEPPNAVICRNCSRPVS